ncbi:hypothetical protein KIN20_038175 [Parelaphostrongylus tenuis]|uniref:Uncharacterized protein n=1 Tax=Parelaphostrongylus tenuis TaxID=148309 RepID=A0AAD5RF96_PARTN|nr:hypothetical protein KIN20_038175 [Parelaphostrongylus tenuis]
MSTRTFTVSGFTLPVAMVYTTPTVSAQVSGIAASRERAQALVQRVTMLAVFDVLELQDRSAFLPDVVISGILSHLTVNITYEPLQCQRVSLNPTADMRGYSMFNVYLDYSQQ